jgi:SAM-dependent methyltransferase
MDYLAANKAYWERGYNAPNVEPAVFRFYGRILKPDFGLQGSGETVVDFGCGQGAAVNFFQTQGFDAYGCDISETDIAAAQIRYPHIARKLSVCDPDPRKVSFYGAPENVRVLIGIQSFYYFSDTDFAVAMDKLYAAMAPRGVFFATMMGERYDKFFNNSEPAHDGLRRVNFKTARYEVKDYYISFIKDEEHLKRKFSMFKPVHIGHYEQQLRADDGTGFHWTFCGVKN